MTLRMQALLLRFLEDGTIHRVGAERQTGIIDVRIVTATNRVLVDRIAAGSFREDLYYRINVIHIVVPPLRERREDIEPLLRHFRMSSARSITSPFRISSQRFWRRSSPTTGRGTSVNSRTWQSGSLSGVAAAMSTFQTCLPRLPAKRPPRRICQHPELGTVAVQRPLRNPNELYQRIVGNRESFWSAVYEPFMSRDLTRDDVRGSSRRDCSIREGTTRCCSMCSTCRRPTTSDS